MLDVLFFYVEARGEHLEYLRISKDDKYLYSDWTFKNMTPSMPKKLFRGIIFADRFYSIATQVMYIESLRKSRSKSKRIQADPYAISSKSHSLVPVSYGDIIGYPPVIKHGLLENGPYLFVIFL